MGQQGDSMVSLNEQRNGGMYRIGWFEWCAGLAVVPAWDKLGKLVLALPALSRKACLRARLMNPGNVSHHLTLKSYGKIQ